MDCRSNNLEKIWSSSPHIMRLAFINATIHTITGPVIPNGTLLVDEGKIVAVGETSRIDSSRYEIIDCSGKHITPGFIDAHSHVGLWEEGAGPGPANSDGNEMTSPITPYLRAMDAIFPEDMGFDDARKGGVTTMGITPGSGNLIGGQFCVVKSYGHVVDDMIIKQPAGVKMALGENAKRVGFNNKRAPTTRMGNAYLIRQAFYEALDYQSEWQQYQDEMRANEKKPPEERKLPKRPKYDLGNEMLLKILSRSVPVRCHSQRADDIRTAIRLSEEFGFQLVIDHATEAHKIKEIIKEKNLPVVVGPLLTNRSKRELKNRTLKTPGIMMKAGVTVAITTDAPVIPINGLRDTVIMAVREGLPATRALETITINPAKILGVDERVGSLEVGKDADFLIFDGDPLDARSAVERTYIDGKLVYHRED